MTKVVYEAPSITEVGTFESLTQGASTGTTLDATFPAGTPFGDLTFS
ncbi:lasso peptide [soil metagenome]